MQETHQEMLLQVQPLLSPLMTRVLSPKGSAEQGPGARGRPSSGGDGRRWPARRAKHRSRAEGREAGTAAARRRGELESGRVE
jgi:hypothetical protein